MRKTVLACALALCLLTGCISSAKQTSVIPLIPIPSATAAPTVSPSPSITPPPEVTPSPSPTEAPPSSETSPEPSETPHDPSPSDDALAERLDEVLTGFTEFSGSVLIGRSGCVLLSKGYGMADAGKELENTTETRFLVGSVTKQFTSMAVMQLYAKGLLDIGDKLSKYVPDFTRGDEIVLQNLLNQNSGIMDFLNDEPELLSTLPTEALSTEYVIGLVKDKPLKFEPGSKYSYSNTNYLLLGYIVEQVSGMSYGDYLKKNIFEPLGMSDTGVVDVAHLPENMAVGNWRTGTPAPFTDDSGAVIADNANSTAGSHGAGCLYSTVWDLYRWDRALSTEKLLPKKYMDMIFTQTVPVVGAVIPSDYGFGWIVQTDGDFGTIHVHTGALGGFRAYNGIFTEHDITVIILFNTMNFKDRDKLIPAVKTAFLTPPEQDGN